MGMCRKKKQNIIYFIINFIKLTNITSFHNIKKLRHLRHSGNHFLKKNKLNEKGWQQYAELYPLFDTAYYLLRYFPKGLKFNPFLHYLLCGWKKDLQPSPFFEPELYRKKSCWDGNENPLFHYHRVGAQQGINPGKWFDFKSLTQFPEYQKKGVNLFALYKVIAASAALEMKGNLQTYFNTEKYLLELPLEQRKRAAVDPLSHFICCKECNIDYRGRNYVPIKTIEDTWGKRFSITKIAEHTQWNSKVEKISQRPLFSILLPVYNPNIFYLKCCLRSVYAQSYPYWQLCIVDDGSNSQEVRSVLQEEAAQESRIHLKFAERNKGIASTTNAAAAMAKGEWLLFLDNDDELCCDALLHIALKMESKEAEGKQYDMFYSDEELIGLGGLKDSTFFKPSFNLRLLYSHNYITHLAVVRKTLFEKIGGLNSVCDGAQDFDLMLKVCEQTQSIYHIEKPLYYWRALSSSTTINHNDKSYADEAGRKALDHFLERRYRKNTENIDKRDLLPLFQLDPPKAEGDKFNFYYRIAPQKTEAPIRIFCYTSDSEKKSSVNTKELLSVCDVQNCTLYTLPHSGIDFVKEINRRVLSAERETNHTKGWLVFMQTPESIDRNWLGSLLAAYIDSDVGMVCGKKTYGKGEVPNFLLPDLNNTSNEYYLQFLQHHSTHANGYHCLQDVLLPAEGVILIHEKRYFQAGGLCEEFSLPFAFFDLALRLRMLGFATIFSPFAEYEFGADDKISHKIIEGSALKEEKRRFQKKWKEALLEYKEFYSVAMLANSGIDRENFERWLVGD